MSSDVPMCEGSLSESRDVPMCDGSLSESLALLCSSGLGQFLEGWLLETLQVRLTTAVAPEFWAELRRSETEPDERGRARVLLGAFRTLLERLEPFLGRHPITRIPLHEYYIKQNIFFYPKQGTVQVGFEPASSLSPPGGLERLGGWQDEARGGLCGPGARGLRERAFSVIRATPLFSPSAQLQERVLAL